MNDVETSHRLPNRRQAAIAGIAAGAAALGGAELLAGLLPGAASPVIAIGDLVIALQPPGAKQFVVDLFGEADKLLLNVLIVGVALGAAALIAIASRGRPRIAAAGIAVFGLLALGAGLRDPLSDPVPSAIVALVAALVAWLTLRRRPRRPPARCPGSGDGPTPASRRPRHARRETPIRRAIGG